MTKTQNKDKYMKLMNGVEIIESRYCNAFIHPPLILFSCQLCIFLLFYWEDEITVFSLPAYIVTWWSIWMLRLFSKQLVTSTWRWTGYAPHSFTSEPSRTPHITVRAQNSDWWLQLSRLFVLDCNLLFYFDFRFSAHLGQVWNWSKIARWDVFKWARCAA